MTHELVGQRFNLKGTPRRLELSSGKIYEYVQYELDDAVMESKIRSMFPDVRIFPPGAMGTADWVPGRTNVYIDKNSFITEVSNG